jgi:hypothetical protein
MDLEPKDNHRKRRAQGIVKPEFMVFHEEAQVAASSGMLLVSMRNWIRSKGLVRNI